MPSTTPRSSPRTGAKATGSAGSRESSNTKPLNETGKARATKTPPPKSSPRKAAKRTPEATATKASPRKTPDAASGKAVQMVWRAAALGIWLEAGCGAQVSGAVRLREAAA